MPLAIFGYGSLWDEGLLGKRAQGARHHCTAHLHDYRLIFNKPGITHRYLNIERDEGSRTMGVIVYVTDAQFHDLARMEQGYHAVDVTAKIRAHRDLLPGTRVVAFVHFGLPFVRMSYINKGLRGVPAEVWLQWIGSIDFVGAIIELDEEPLCDRAVLKSLGRICWTSEQVQVWFDERTCADLEALRKPQA